MALKIFSEKSFYAGFDEHQINVAYKMVVDDIDIDTITHKHLPCLKLMQLLALVEGKLLDFAKYSAYLLKLPFISVPTSTSNDGFCSPTSSLTVQGKRKTVKSGIPYGVVIDLDIIKKIVPAFSLFRNRGYGLKNHCSLGLERSI